jgi:hypothetical protein
MQVGSKIVPGNLQTKSYTRAMFLGQGSHPNRKTIEDTVRYQGWLRCTARTRRCRLSRYSPGGHQPVIISNSTWWCSAKHYSGAVDTPSKRVPAVPGGQILTPAGPGRSDVG